MGFTNINTNSDVRVLAVDDRRENLAAIKALLQNLGVTIQCATSGEEALKMMLRHDFALVLLDVQMPGMDGFETASLMQSNNSTRSIPIIFLTARQYDKNQVLQGYRVGGIDYIIKPLDDSTLIGKVASFCRLYRQKRNLHKQEKQLRIEVAEHAKAEESLLAAKKEADDILATMEQGLFLLYDCEGRYMIGEQYSKALKEMLGTPDPAHQELIPLLEKGLPGEIFANVREYLKLMFQHDVPLDALNELNPLRAVAFRAVPWSGFTPRPITIRF